MNSVSGDNITGRGSRYGQKSILHLLFLQAVVLIIAAGCEKFFYTEPIQYPEDFTFKGNVITEDSVPIPLIRVVLHTPGEVDTITAFSNNEGYYEFSATLEYAGPNTIKVRDTDGPDNGGYFSGTDTVFYINQDYWDTKTADINFRLKSR